MEPSLSMHIRSSNANVMETKIQVLETLITPFILWEKQHTAINSEFEIKSNFERFQARVKKLTEFIKNNELRIYVIGGTSAGKSLYINSLFGENILKSAQGHTTPCFVEISCTDNSQSYYQTADGTRCTVDFSNPNDRLAFHKKIDNVRRSEALHSRAKLYLSSRMIGNNSVPSANVTIVDCPGLERSEFRKEGAKMIESADAVVLIVNVLTGQNEELNKGIFYQCSFLVKPNVIVLFNKTDVLMRKKDDDNDEDDDPDRPYELIKNSTEEMVEFLTRPGGPYDNEEEARNAIFFISAKEQRLAQIRSNDPAKLSLISKAASTAEASKRETDQKRFGYRQTKTGFTIDSESLCMAFQASLRSLLSIARDHRQEKKMKRLEREIAICKQHIISTASDVESQLLNLETKISDSIGMLRKDRDREDIDICTIFANYVYSEMISDDNTELTGKEKLEIFIESLHANRELVSSFMMKSFLKENTEQRLISLFNQMFEEAFDKVFEVERSRSDEDLSRRLDPATEAHEQLNRRLKEIKDQNMKSFRNRIQTEVDKIKESEVEEKKRIEQHIKANRESLEQAQKSKEAERNDADKEIDENTKKLSEEKSRVKQKVSEVENLKKTLKDLDKGIDTCRLAAKVGFDTLLIGIGVVITPIALIVMKHRMNRKDAVAEELEKATSFLDRCRQEKTALEKKMNETQQKREEIENALKETREKLHAVKRSESLISKIKSPNNDQINQLEKQIRYLEEKREDNELKEDRVKEMIQVHKNYENQLLQTQQEHLRILKEFMRHLIKQISEEFESRVHNKIQQLKTAREALTVIKQRN